MADKCDICGTELKESFLKKLEGTYVKIDGKQKKVCSSCQSKHKNKLREQL